MHYIPQDGYYFYFRYKQHTVMVAINKNHGDTALDLSRFKAMVKAQRVGAT